MVKSSHRLAAGSPDTHSHRAPICCVSRRVIRLLNFFDMLYNITTDEAMGTNRGLYSGVSPRI